jgi:hypothetical protein
VSYLFPSPLPWTGRPPFPPWRKLLVLPIRWIPPPYSRYYDSRHTTARRTPCVVIGLTLTPHDRKAAAHVGKAKKPCLAQGRYGRVLKPDPYSISDIDVEVTQSSVIVAPSTWPDTKSDSSCPGPCSVVVTTLASPEQRRTTYIFCPPTKQREIDSSKASKCAKPPFTQPALLIADLQSTTLVLAYLRYPLPVRVL